jgi:glycerol kinase
MAAHPTNPTCVLALDQGTTSSRAMLFDRHGRPLATAQEEFPQHTRLGEGGVDLGIVEHDPEDIWRTQLDCARRVLSESGTPATAVAAIGITNQRETTILWERATGRPVAPAIVWQSRVSAPVCARLKARGLEADIRRRTGLVLDPYFSATKIVHLLETMPGLRERCVAGEILFGTVDTFLIWRLTGGRVHATDPTNASRTLLFDIDRQAWSAELCGIFDIPPAILPEVRPSSGSFGTTAAKILGAELPITGCAGDQQAGGFAQGCLAAGDAKCTYGTGAFLLCSTGARHVESSAGLLSTLGCACGAGPNYMLEGSVFVAGSLVGWLRDGLGIIGRASDIEPLARSVADTGGVMLVPALTGLGAPFWDPHARGLLVGITRGTTAAHIARAALQAISLSVADVVSAMEQDAGAALPRLRVDGGAAANDLLMQMQADVLGRPVERPAMLETTALGAALLAGIAMGFFADAAAVSAARSVDRVFEPQISDAARRTLVEKWHDAVGRSRGWAMEDRLQPVVA